MIFKVNQILNIHVAGTGQFKTLDMYFDAGCYVSHEVHTLDDEGNPVATEILLNIQGKGVEPVYVLESAEQIADMLSEVHTILAIQNGEVVELYPTPEFPAFSDFSSNHVYTLEDEE